MKKFLLNGVCLLKGPNANVLLLPLLPPPPLLLLLMLLLLLLVFAKCQYLLYHFDSTRGPLQVQTDTPLMFRDPVFRPWDAGSLDRTCLSQTAAGEERGGVRNSAVRKLFTLLVNTNNYALIESSFQVRILF